MASLPTFPTVYLEDFELTAGVERVVTTDVFRCVTLWLNNSSSAERTITIQNTAGAYIARDTVLPANTPLPALGFPFRFFRGLRMTVSGDGVFAHVEGYPNV